MVAVTAHRVETASALPEAVERLASAAERAATARLDLALHSIAQTVKSFSVSAGLIAAALIVGLFSWICVIAGIVTLLAQAVGFGWSLLIVGVVQLLIAAALVLPAIKMMQATRIAPGAK